MFDIFLAWLMFWFIIAPVMFMVGIGALIEDPTGSGIQRHLHRRKPDPLLWVPLVNPPI